MFSKLVATGQLGFGMNEINLHSLVDDPPKYTLSSSSAALGAWSARYVVKDGSGVELALIQFKKDERTRGRDDILWGEWTVHIKGPERFPGDDGMRLVFLALHDYVWFIGQPGPFPPQHSFPPPPPEPELDEWMSEANVKFHIAQLDAIALEFAEWGGPEFVPDASTRQAYILGRNRNIKEVHDDMMNRNNGQHSPHMHLAGGGY